MSSEHTSWFPPLLDFFISSYYLFMQMFLFFNFYLFFLPALNFYYLFAKVHSFVLFAGFNFKLGTFFIVYSLTFDG